MTRECIIKEKTSVSIKGIIIILGLSFWPLYVSMFTKETIASFDSFSHFLPLRYNAIYTMLEGHLPLWNPYILSGTPLIGDAISNPLDVLNIVFILMNPVIASAVLSSVQLFLSGLFMYIYLKKSLELSDLSCLLGGILYVFNPVLIYGIGQRLDFIDPIGSFLWLPLIVLLVDKAIEKQSYHLVYYAVLAAIAVSLAMFGGNINIVFFMFLFLTMYIILREASLKNKIKILGTIGITFILITSIQLLPILENASKGHRALLWEAYNYDRKSGLDIFSVFFSIILYPNELITSLYKINFLDSFASKYFNVNLKSFYVGIFDLFLLIIAYITPTKRNKINVLKVTAVLVLLCMVSIYYLPIKGMLVYIFPVLKGVHFYIHFLFYFCTIVLVAYAFDNFVFKNANSSKIIKYIPMCTISSFLLLLLVLLMIVLPWLKNISGYFNPGYFIGISVIIICIALLYLDLVYRLLYITTNRYKRNEVRPFSLILPFLLIGFAFIVIIISDFVDPEIFFNPHLNIPILRIILYVTLLFYSFYMLYLIATDSQQKKVTFGSLLLLLIILNIMAVREHDFLSLKNDIFKKHFKETKEALFFKKIKPTERFEIISGSKAYWSQHPFGFNSPLFYRVSISGGSHQLMSARYREFFDMINHRYPFNKSYYWKEGKYIYPSAYAYLDNGSINLDALHLLGIKYFFAKEERNESFLNKVETGDYYNIYENTNAIPRCFIVYDSEVLPSDEILKRLNSSAYDPLKKVLIEEPTHLKKVSFEPTQSATIDTTECSFVNYTPNEISIRALSKEDGYMVLTDAYDDGWKAYIDGYKTDIYQANYLFRAILLPKGEHTVKFIYMPLSFIYGACISFLVSVAIFIFFVAYHIKLKKVKVNLS